MNRKLCAAAFVVACVSARGRGAHANEDSEPRRAPGPRCADARDADSVVACALAASPEVAEARAQVEAAAGRRATAGSFLPSNPTVAGTVANRRREEAPTSVLNWSVSISQEVEIAGQRSARLDQSEADRDARAARLRVVEQEVAAGALSAYYEAIAAREALTFASELAATARSLAEYAEGRAKEELAAGVEADVARAEATRIGVVRFEAERHLTEAVAVLSLLLDVPATQLSFPEALPHPAPIPLNDGAFADQAVRLRGEIAAAEAERRVLERRLVVVRKERISNPTISLFAERGEVNDHIFGVGLAFPVPLPAPVGRTRAGDIAETLAQLRAAESSRELVRRRVLSEVARAAAAYRAKVGEADLFAGDLVTRARADLAALREALATRRMTLREGLQWQRSLIELLSADVDARLARLTAALELRRVTGLPLGAQKEVAR
jgi:cobalt-zinc-cadmium efflux system outer membrane protein